MTQQNIQQIKRTRDIIAYDVSRKYFGQWTPYELNRSYWASVKKNDSVSLHIGLLSVDDICTALWTEMSYNPVRFGTKSPFKFQDKNSIEHFVNTKIDTGDQEHNIVLAKIQNNLRKFLKIITRCEPSFSRKRFLSKTSLDINQTPSQNPMAKPVPNWAYEMLDCLRDCIHAIASQNLADFHRKSYQTEILEKVKSRHPNLIRPTKIPNFPAIEKYADDEKRLTASIFEKNGQISDTQMRIDALQEYDPPIDTSAERKLLRKYNNQLRKLDTILATIRANKQRLLTR